VTRGRAVRHRLVAVAYAYPIVVGVLLLCVVSALVHPGFLASSNWGATVNGAAPVVILSMAQAVAVISGRAGVDLSVGPLAGLVNAVIVVELAGRGLTAPIVVVAASLAVGLVSGALNGFLVAYLRIPAIVATLGTYLAYLGLTLQILPTSGGAAPSWLSGLAGNVSSIPAMLIPIAVVALVWLALTATPYRRNLFAVGADERSAYSAGVDVQLTRFMAYCTTGLIGGIAGLALTALLQSGDPGVSAVFTLQSIAGVALGGIALAGGRGGLLGAACGGATLFLVQNLLSLAHVGLDGLQVAYGVILLLAVAANSLSGRSRRRHKDAAAAPVASRGQTLDGLVAS